MYVPTSRRGLATFAIYLGILTTMALTVGGNIGVMADTPDEAGINETQRQGMLEEHGNLEEYERDTNITQIPPEIREYALKPSFRYVLTVADGFAGFVYHTELPLIVYQLIAALPAVGSIGFALSRAGRLVQQVIE